MKTKGLRVDSAGCIGSYAIDSEPMTIGLPPESYWWRAHDKHFKIYVEDVVVGNRTRTDLKKVPPEANKVRIKRYDMYRCIYYEVSWL